MRGQTTCNSPFVKTSTAPVGTYSIKNSLYNVEGPDKNTVNRMKSPFFLTFQEWLKIVQ